MAGGAPSLSAPPHPRPPTLLPYHTLFRSTGSCLALSPARGGRIILFSDEEGCAGWSYEEVLPYFKRAEDNQSFVNDYHSYGGPLGVSNRPTSTIANSFWKICSSINPA